MTMKIIDFDQKFFEYARAWVLKHPGLNEEQVEDSYNQMMQEWVSAPADWLDGACPAEYFNQFENAQDLIDGMLGYAESGVNLPEPLYTRIVNLGEAAAPLLRNILRDAARSEALRAEAMGMLRDMDSRIADADLEDLVCAADQANELSDLAADVLSARDASVANRLLNRWEEATEYARMLILDICCNYPGDDRILQHLLHYLKNDPDQRALWASCLGKLGDERAVAPLQEMLNSVDLRYLDYIELRAAVESLGGDAGEDRSFYGDPDFEALRSL